jgi:hypothetical protein
VAVELRLTDAFAFSDISSSLSRLDLAIFFLWQKQSKEKLSAWQGWRTVDFARESTSAALVEQLHTAAEAVDRQCRCKHNSDQKDRFTAIRLGKGVQSKPVLRYVKEKRSRDEITQLWSGFTPVMSSYYKFER